MGKGKFVYYEKDLKDQGGVIMENYKVRWEIQIEAFVFLSG